jgi:hypothetical protein
MAYDAWRGEKVGAVNSPGHSINDLTKENSDLSSKNHAGTPTATNVFRAPAPGIDTLFDNDYRAKEDPLNIGNTLDADIDNGFAEIGAPAVDIGEPLDPDNPITDYTSEAPLNLGEFLNADNPDESIIDDPSAYQNIGKTIVVGEELNWLDDEPQNIGPLLDVDSQLP